MTAAPYNPKTQVTPQPYAPPQIPQLTDLPSLAKWVQQQFQGISNSVQNLNQTMGPATGSPPRNPLVGQQAYAVAPWANTLGHGEGLYIFKTSGGWTFIA